MSLVRGLCNVPSGKVEGKCTAAASLGLGQGCNEHRLCSSGLCDPRAGCVPNRNGQIGAACTDHKQCTGGLCNVPSGKVEGKCTARASLGLGKALLRLFAARRQSHAVTAVALGFMSKRHALLAAVLVPLVVPEALAASALGVLAFALLVELVSATVVVSLQRASATSAACRQLTADANERPSIMPG